MKTTLSLRSASFLFLGLFSLLLVGYFTYRFTGSEKIIKEPVEAPPLEADYSNMCEQSARLYSETDKFTKEESRLRHKITAFKAVIQHEQWRNEPRHRSLNLMLAIQPELFDSFHVALHDIGFVTTDESMTTDRNIAFRELNAKKASLEASISKLMDLKSSPDSIGTDLQKDLLETEWELQQLEVELRNYSSKNESCTLRFSLQESFATRTIHIK